MLTLHTISTPLAQHDVAQRMVVIAAAGRTPPASVGPRDVQMKARTDAQPREGSDTIYTLTQAERGKAVYARSCISCHGSNLQGVAAPAIAGEDFLTTAQSDGWTVGILRTIVTQNMPLNDPGSLSRAQYAAVLAYVFAANCSPRGTKPFPEHALPAFAKMKISTASHPSARRDKFGVCPVK
jgi:mono/diheme cytochrome c family protein